MDGTWLEGGWEGGDGGEDEGLVGRMYTLWDIGRRVEGL